MAEIGSIYKCICARQGTSTFCRSFVSYTCTGVYDDTIITIYSFYRNFAFQTEIPRLLQTSKESYYTPIIDLVCLQS